MSFTREDYAKLYDFAEDVCRSHPPLRHDAIVVMYMCEQVIGSIKSYDSTLDYAKELAKVRAQGGKL